MKKIWQLLKPHFPPFLFSPKFNKAEMRKDILPGLSGDISPDYSRRERESTSEYLSDNRGGTGPSSHRPRGGLSSAEKMTAARFRLAAQKARDAIEEAQREAEAVRKEAEIQAKDHFFQVKAEFEAEAKDRRQELLNMEKRLLQAVLLQVEDPELIGEIFRAAREIKLKIYGKRLVLFAPLYLSNYCINNCLYCGFRKDNGSISRKRLTLEEIREQVGELENLGHKRLLIECGESLLSAMDFVEEAIAAIYACKNGKGEIRRVNVNIAATTVDQYRRLKAAKIGTYQLFQETYHRPTYEALHEGPKGDYDRQIFALDRAQEAGIDDVGLGVLFGLYDYRFEVLALLYHARHLEEKFGVGPHTISVPDGSRPRSRL